MNDGDEGDEARYEEVLDLSFQASNSTSAPSFNQNNSRNVMDEEFAQPFVTYAVSIIFRPCPTPFAFLN